MSALARARNLVPGQLQNPGRLRHGLHRMQKAILQKLLPLFSRGFVARKLAWMSRNRENFLIALCLVLALWELSRETAILFPATFEFHKAPGGVLPPTAMQALILQHLAKAYAAIPGLNGSLVLNGSTGSSLSSVASLSSAAPVPHIRQSAKPLMSRYLLEGFNFTSKHNRLVLLGKITQEEASQTNLPAEELNLLNSLLPMIDIVQKTKYKSCAVVGNSPTLREQQYASRIDAHDVVLRFNEAPTKGYELTVGKRATFRANTESWVQTLITRGVKDAGKSSHKRYVPGARTLLLFGDVSILLYIELLRKFQEHLIFFVAPGFTLSLQKIYEEIKRRMDAVGLHTEPEVPGAPRATDLVLLFMKLCKRVHVYGFDPTPPSLNFTTGNISDVDALGPPKPSFYYEKSSFVLSDVLATEFQFTLLRAMSLENLISLHQ
eukprot:jgi/Mesvir1/17902/Mv12970-RA.1